MVKIQPPPISTKDQRFARHGGAVKRIAGLLRRCRQRLGPYNDGAFAALLRNVKEHIRAKIFLIGQFAGKALRGPRVGQR